MHGIRRFIGNPIGALMAMAGSALPIIAEPQRLHPPKEYPPHERHQGLKERARRLKRLAMEEE